MATDKDVVTRYDGQGITGKIKAWNVAKGFGFADADDGGEDIFMHQSVIEVEDSRYRSICPGTKVEMTYFDRNGKHTASKVTASGGTPFKGFASKQEASAVCAARTVDSLGGKVKWYNTTKGFGFIIPEEGGNDVFFGIKDVQDQQILQTDEQVVYHLEHMEDKVKASKVRSINIHRSNVSNSPLYSSPPTPYGFPPAGGPPTPQYPQYQQYQPHQPQGYPPMGGGMGGGMGMGYGGPGGHGAPAPGGMRTGTCKWYNVTKAFGFILPSEGGKDIYFREVSPPPVEGDPVEFEIKVNDGKAEAVNVVQTKNRKRKVMDPSYQGQMPSSYAPQTKSQRPGSYPPIGAPHAGMPHTAPGPQSNYDPYSSGQSPYGQPPSSVYPPNGSASPYSAPQQAPASSYGGYPQNGMSYY